LKKVAVKSPEKAKTVNNADIKRHRKLGREKPQNFFAVILERLAVASGQWTTRMCAKFRMLLATFWSKR